jgi:translation elongation factor EF-Tu-like GTPase
MSYVYDILFEMPEFDDAEEANNVAHMLIEALEELQYDTDDKPWKRTNHKKKINKYVQRMVSRVNREASYESEPDKKSAWLSVRNFLVKETHKLNAVKEKVADLVDKVW